MVKYDSLEEQYFSDWLNELKHEGYIKDWERITTPLPLTQGLTHTWTETVHLKKKTKTVSKSQVLLRASEYTPDFGIIWLSPAQHVFFQSLASQSKITSPFLAFPKDGNYYSYVEVKADFDFKNMTRGFVNNQKVIWDKYKKFINLIKLGELFRETFAPKSYFKTPTGLKRKFSKGTPLTYEQFHDQI